MVEIFPFGLERHQPLVKLKREKMVSTERRSFHVDKKEEQVFGAGRRRRSFQHQSKIIYY